MNGNYTITTVQMLALAIFCRTCFFYLTAEEFFVVLASAVDYSLSHPLAVVALCSDPQNCGATVMFEGIISDLTPTMLHHTMQYQQTNEPLTNVGDVFYKKPPPNSMMGNRAKLPLLAKFKSHKAVLTDSVCSVLFPPKHFEKNPSFQSEMEFLPSDPFACEFFLMLTAG